MAAKKRKRRKVHLAAGVALFPDEGGGPAPKPRRAGPVEDDPRAAYAREQAAAWAAEGARRLAAALENVAQRRGDLLDTYRVLYQAASQGNAAAQQALDTIAPVLADNLRRRGYYYAKSIGRWLPRPATSSLFDDNEDLYTQPHTAPATPVEGGSILDYLAEHPHPALRGLRGTRRAAATRSTVLAEQALARAGRATSCAARQQEALAALHYASQAHEETRWRGGAPNLRSNALERQAANLLLLPCNLPTR